MMTKLILVRHGQSTSNRDNVFTGWNDVSLTDIGRQQAIDAGQKIKKTKVEFTEIHTSILARAINTAYLIADEIKQSYIPIFKTWRLNERHYGALKGLNKDTVRHIYGSQKVELWRRSFYSTPPLLEEKNFDRRYQFIPKNSIPRAESLETSLKRVLVYYEDSIAPKIKKDQNILLVAHGSTIRVLIKYFDQITGNELDGVIVDNGSPIVYEFDEKLKVIDKYFI